VKRPGILFAGPGERMRAASKKAVSSVASEMNAACNWVLRVNEDEETTRQVATISHYFLWGFLLVTKGMFRGRKMKGRLMH